MPLPLTLMDTDGLSPAGYPVLQLQQATEQNVAVYLKEADGTEYVAASGNVVTLTTSETLAGYPVDMLITCTWTTPSTGLINVPVPHDEEQTPGIWIGEFTVYEDSTQAKALRRFRCYVEIQPSLAKLGQAQVNAPLSIAEIRMAMRDRCAEDNFLLDSMEFSDSEIAFCIRRPVDWWNETAQRLRIATYTYTTFPYRYHWLDATVGELLKIGSYNLNRNRITLNAGGINTDDKERGKLYLELSDKLIKEYHSWGTAQMKGLNLQGWGGFVRNGWF